MLVLEGHIDLPCCDADSPAKIRRSLFAGIQQVRQYVHSTKYGWFYVLSSMNGTRYLRRQKTSQAILISQDKHNTAPKASETSERKRFLFDAAPRCDDALELVYSDNEFTGKETSYALLHHLKISDAAILSNPHSSILVSSENQRCTASGIALSSAATELACEILDSHIDSVPVTLAQTLSFALSTLRTDTFLSTLTSNIEYREKFLGEDHEVVDAARTAVVQLVEHYGAVLHKPPASSIRDRAEALSAAASGSTFLQHRNLVLPIHWLCNNLGIRFGQEILILRALMSTFQSSSGREP
jgi:hypothetical protein